jgi:hypothetical protein
LFDAKVYFRLAAFNNARKGAVKKRSQAKTTWGGASAWKTAQKFKGVRVERAAAKKQTVKKTTKKKSRAR